MRNNGMMTLAAAGALFLCFIISTPALQAAVAPELAAVGNKSVNEGAQLSLTLSATDADGDTLTYSAGNLPSGAAFNAATKQFSWTPNYSQSGTYAGVRFSVTDGAFIDYEDITIAVANVDTTPAFVYSLNTHFAFPNTQLQISVKAADVDGDAVTYVDPVSGLPPGAVIDSVNRKLTWTPALGEVGKSYTLTFQATDGKTTGTKTATIYIIEKKSSSVDLSAYLPPIGSQIGNSCVAWSVGYYQKTFKEGREKGWDLTAKNHQCSPTFIFGQAGFSSGMYFGDAYTILKQQGCASLEAMPHTSATLYSLPTINQFEEGMPQRLSAQTDIDYLKVIEDIRNKLAAGEVVGIGVNVYSDWLSASGGNDVHNGPPNGTTYLGGHGLTVIGYDDNRAYTDAGGYTQYGAFKIANSWGSTWSTDGYIWFSYSAMQSFTYSRYSMADRNNYSVGATARFKIEHPAYSQLFVEVGVGNPASPTWKTSPYRNQIRTITEWEYSFDLTDAAAYLPPGPANKWYLKVYDSASGSTGSLKQFEIIQNNIIYSAVGLPSAIPDNNASGITLYITGPAVINTPPTRPTVSINPVSPKTADDLICLASGSLDADGDPITYSYSWYKDAVVQSALTNNVVGAINTAKGQVWKCVVTPSDGNESGPSAEAQVSIANTSPILNAIGDKVIDEGAILGFQVVAADADADVLTFAAANLPSGAAFDVVTKSFCWTPAYSQAGTYAVVFTVNDGVDTVSETVGITVNQVALMYGDVSNDASISAYDAALTAQNSAGLNSFSTEQQIRGDVSGDSNISAYDAALIAQYSVGLITTFPVES